MNIAQIVRNALRSSLRPPADVDRVPGDVERFLADYPSFKASLARRPDIAFASVPKWQAFGKYGTREEFGSPGRTGLSGWRREGSSYRMFGGTCPELTNLTRKQVIDDWRCDLQDVHGCAASKSQLTAFTSTDQMVEANSSEVLQDVSPEGLRAHLEHKEIGTTGENPGSDWLQAHQWDERMFVVNKGGLHHLFAAKYIAARIQEPVGLCAPLHYYSVNPEAVAALRSEYDVYIVNNDFDLSGQFLEAMGNVGATYLWNLLPEPYENERAIFLPRAEPLSMKVSEAFQAAGFEELGAYLEEVAKRETPLVISKYLMGGQEEDAAEEHHAERG